MISPLCSYVTQLSWTAPSLIRRLQCRSHSQLTHAVPHAPAATQTDSPTHPPTQLNSRDDLTMQRRKCYTAADASAADVCGLRTRLPMDSNPHTIYGEPEPMQVPCQTLRCRSAGDQYMLGTFLADSQYFVDLPLFTTSDW